MPAPRAKAKPAPPAIMVVLEGQSVKGKSIKYFTEVPGLAFNNLYVQKSALEKLGNPATLKVTIEPGE